MVFLPGAALLVVLSCPQDFATEVRPILARRCFACHGNDEEAREAGLRLDSFAAATLDRDGFPAIVPGHAEQSELMARIESEFDPMPPESTGEPLSADEQKILRRWIDGGAEYAPHWSFVPPVAPEIEWDEPVEGASMIDAFVGEQHAAHGLTWSPQADDYTLFRRASLDLTGLLPTPEAARAYAASTESAKFEEAVDRLLDSPGYAERWATVWLDLARYADSSGHGSDPLRTIWRYRDWVIEAFDKNMPFDQFTVEQLAGDLLPDANVSTKLATAFHRNTMTNTEGGTDDEEFRVLAVKDRVNTTMSVWMGLTAGCAECHSHKFDPISHAEYYQLFDIFNQTADTDQNDDRPRLATPTQSEIETKAEPTTTPVMQELPLDQRRVSHVLTRGNFMQKAEEVHGAVPAAFPPLPDGVEPNRLALAQWLVSDGNPLTARVTVNRVWARLFGRGLVLTEGDFGSQGSLPSHRRLLDWLSVEFKRSGWDHKALLRTILSSRTYRQSSDVTDAGLAADPEGVWLGRYPRQRLEAEMVRDTALEVAGLLSRKRFGPSVYPPQPEGLWQAAFNGQRDWKESTGEDRYRRGLYVFLRRTIPYPMLTTFDAASRETCTVRRIPTNTPLQAFALLNDPVFVEASQGLAQRALGDAAASQQGPDATIEQMLWYALARPPEAAQITVLAALYSDASAAFSLDAEGANAFGFAALEGQELAAHERAAWTLVASTVLNLDSVLTKE